MYSPLLEQKCRPCEGNVAPLNRAGAETLLKELNVAWKYDEAASQISRYFEFPTFARTIAFANAIAWISTTEGHHPQMTVSYNTLVVVYRTTSIDGLSDNDFICAAKIDRLAVDI